MIIIIESILFCALFTVGVCFTIKDPIQDINNYPPAIIQRCSDLGLITDDMKPGSKKVILKKLVGAIFFLFAFAAAMRWINGATSFLQGFGISYLLWNIIDWYDAIVLDCIWFCHSKKVIIPGTEDMVDEYKNYAFHIIGSAKGMLLGLPICILVGLIVQFVF